ncbi:hypothetical protein LCGC14_0772390 [marine sediment metagenome]|uniref:Uncharacterized protein n=1 Tax=marine sediment metagenome TaxID=412755 RepID=A0A0F9Q229_9ZZZZ
MSWDKYQRAAERGPMSLFWKVFFPVLLVVIVLGVAGFVLNPFRQASRILNKTINADNVIYNYEWFKQRHEAIGAIDAKVVGSQSAVNQFKADAGPRDNWHFQDREEYARLNSVLLGLRQQRADLAAEYNARSRMTNRAIFKAGDTELPDSIPVE